MRGTLLRGSWHCIDKVSQFCSFDAADASKLLEEELGKVAVVESCALLHLRDDPVDRAGLVRLRLRRGDKRRRGDVVAAARRVLKRFAADEHTYVEVTDAASPKSVITQSRAVSTFSGPFTGISCRPCKN